MKVALESGFTHLSCFAGLERGTYQRRDQEGEGLALTNGMAGPQEPSAAASVRTASV